MAGVIFDTFLVFQFLKRLVQPFNETEAFKNGLIDDRGARTTKKITTTDEKNSYRVFDKMVFNLKKLIEKLPFGKTRLASYAAALLLIREHQNPTVGDMLTENMTADMLAQSIVEIRTKPEVLQALMESAEPITEAVTKMKKIDAITWEFAGYYIVNMEDKTWTVFTAPPSGDDLLSGKSKVISSKHKTRERAKQDISFMLHAEKRKAKLQKEEMAVGNGAIAGINPGEDPPVGKKRKKKKVLRRNITSFKSFVKEDTKLTKADLDSVEKYADDAFSKMKIDVEFTKHFLDRVNDARNGQQITPAELKSLFAKVAKKHAGKIRQLGDDAEGVIKSNNTDINSPFVLDLDRSKGWIDMTMKTVMRKKDFKSPDKKFAVEQALDELQIKIPDPSKSLGIPRSKMPQVKGKHYPELFAYLEALGATITSDTVAAKQLKPVQKEFSKAGMVKSLNKSVLSDKRKPLIASSDNFIIDGHHRWLATINIRPNSGIPIMRVDMPARKLMAVIVKFPKTTFKDIYQ